ncbi:MAG: sulfatase-like hydrolase/transferase [Mariniblastus sp.]
MNRKRTKHVFKISICFALCCTSGFFLPFACEAALTAAGDVAEKPNIVVVFIDDMGWADFSCFGNKAVETQNIDRLAREGIRFEQFYVNSPICSPSRVALSTGQYPARWKITSFLNNRKSNKARGIAQWLDPSAPMLARILQDSGYATGHFGKWHMGGQRDVGDAPLITEYGFDKSLTNFEGLGPRVLALKDAYDGNKAIPHTLGSDKLGRGEITYVDRSLVTQSFTAAAIDFIKSAETDSKPFYVNVWPDDVHSPFFPPEARRGEGAKRELYHGVLDTMDEQLGVLFDYIRDNENLRNNTLIIVCSDNGPEQGAGSAGPFRGYKTHLFEGGVRSSLVCWGPGLVEAVGQVNKQSIFSAIDLAPSLLELADVDAPDGVKFDGENLLGTLIGKTNSSRSAPLFFRRPPDRDSFYGISDCPDLAVREGNWKLLCEYDGSDGMLFNLDKDPSESDNLITAQPEIAKRLTDAVKDWNASMPKDNGATYQPPAKKKRTRKSK